MLRETWRTQVTRPTPEQKFFLAQKIAEILSCPSSCIREIDIRQDYLTFTETDSYGLTFGKMKGLSDFFQTTRIDVEPRGGTYRLSSMTEDSWSETNYYISDLPADFWKRFEANATEEV